MNWVFIEEFQKHVLLFCYQSMKSKSDVFYWWFLLGINDCDYMKDFIYINHQETQSRFSFLCI